MRLRPCRSPLARSSAWTRGAPQVWREVACTVRIRRSKAASEGLLKEKALMEDQLNQAHGEVERLELERQRMEQQGTI